MYAVAGLDAEGIAATALTALGVDAAKAVRAWSRTERVSRRHSACPVDPDVST
eukprot:gene12345-12433_t